MPSKLNEFLKAKIKLNKKEAKVLAKLIFRRFAEIFEKNKHYCIGDWCEDCPLHDDDCEYVNKCLDEMYDTVELIEKALNLDYILYGTLKEQYEQIGNAVPPLMSYRLAEAVALKERGYLTLEEVIR